MPRAVSFVFVLIAVAACSRKHEPHRGSPESDVVARTLCEHYWKFTSASARPYASMEACLRAETYERPCALAQAQACAAFAQTLRPGTPGDGLIGSPDCAACLARKPEIAMQAAAGERKALEHATLTVHAATIDSGEWPADLAPLKSTSTVLARLDIELVGYGSRIDPDDFEIVPATGAPDAIASEPYTERLTHAGVPVAWNDPSIVNDPDLRIVAYFAVPTTARGQSLAVSYNGKISSAFELR